MKNENKIRKLLGNDYHLGVEINWDNNGYEKTTWKLFRRYNDSKMYFSTDNKAIMTSEENNEEELLKFAKEHHKYNYTRVHEIYRIIVAAIVAIVLIANIFINNSYIRAIGLSIDTYLIIDCFISFKIIDHNQKIEWKQWCKDMELLLKEGKKDGSI